MNKTNKIEQWIEDKNLSRAIYLMQGQISGLYATEVVLKKYRYKNGAIAYTIDMTIDGQHPYSTNEMCKAIAKVLKIKYWTDIKIQGVTFFKEQNMCTFEYEQEAKE